MWMMWLENGPRPPESLVMWSTLKSIITNVHLNATSSLLSYQVCYSYYMTSLILCIFSVVDNAKYMKVLLSDTVSMEEVENTRKLSPFSINTSKRIINFWKQVNTFVILKVRPSYTQFAMSLKLWQFPRM